MSSSATPVKKKKKVKSTKDHKTATKCSTKPPKAAKIRSEGASGPLLRTPSVPQEPPILLLDLPRSRELEEGEQLDDHGAPFDDSLPGINGSSGTYTGLTHPRRQCPGSLLSVFRIGNKARPIDRAHLTDTYQVDPDRPIDLGLRIGLDLHIVREFHGRLPLQQFPGHQIALLLKGQLTAANMRGEELDRHLPRDRSSHQYRLSGT
ncbi:UNVERIFIED_CONTAM: hypothetical protein K2H54_012001 [Gekko kuhli]